jgi:DNA repair protein RadD
VPDPHAANRRTPTADSCLDADRPPRLRPYQERVVSDFLRFFANAERGGTRARFGRIVMPPRTGKTVIAGQIIQATRLPAVFVVPTRTLVVQAARELAHWLNEPVGTFFGESKDLVAGGTNVTTYALLQKEFREGARWPRAVREAPIVFLDEAHHVMTEERLELVSAGFSPDTVRLAMTATPDYDEHRALCRFFPALVHEMTLEEALALDLLAPLRVWVLEVDAEGSTVKLIGGDFDEESLGRVMSAAPFFHAVAALRYREASSSKAALIACASRQQASDLRAFLDTHRQAGRLRPGLVLGDTPRNERERLLADFERGRLDTLIQVGVLIEGWTSAACTLLVDLSHST